MERVPIVRLLGLDFIPVKKDSFPADAELGRFLGRPKGFNGAKTWIGLASGLSTGTILGQQGHGGDKQEDGQ